MSSYKKSIILAITLFSFTACSNKNNIINEPSKEFKKNESIVNYELENPYIMFALEYENQNRYYDAANIYKILFEKTNNFEYLSKYINLNFQFKSYKNIDEIIDKKVLNQLEDLEEEEHILRIYALSLLKVNKKEEALETSKKILEKYKKDINYELLGSIYLDRKEYATSYEMFEQAFKLNNSSNTLMTITNIQYYYLLQKEQAKKRIENYIDEEKQYFYNLCLQLLMFYEKDKQNDKILDLLEKMYDSYKIGDETTLAENTQKLYIRYLASQDINKAIKFVQDNKLDDELLLKLYRIANQTENAYSLLEKMYKETNNYDYLAQMAIIEFEEAEDKNEVLDIVIEKFEKALENISNDVYENYLAYLLIDYDKDYNKAILLVNKALEKQPDNLAYLDTLAWGEYKLKNCQKAYEVMKKVVDQTGLDDDEIKFHWEKIKECNK